MDVDIAEAKRRFSELVRAAEHGETIVITREGKAVAQLTSIPSKRRKVRLGGMKDRIQLWPGWDAPVDLNGFLEGDV